MKRLTMQSLASQSLALVPLVVGIVFGALVLPRGVAPEELPAPIIDARLLAVATADDDARADRVENAPLSSSVRAVGSAFRGFNDAEGHRGDEATISHARDVLIRAVRDTTNADLEGLLDLRAYQLRQFLAEVRRFESAGVASEELTQLGGTFVDRMQKVGWCVRNRLVLPEEARRVAFKLTWNRTLGLDASPAFALSLDEHRALYAFYFSHPHAPENDRARIEATLQRTPSAVARERAVVATDQATANWLISKVAELARLDPTYPADLARGAALYLRHDYRGSAALYQYWLDQHPNGLWTLRVQNHLRAAGLAAEKEVQ